jgi:hypothetical protein
VLAISPKSCIVLNNLGPKIQWLHSYVTADKIYCVYIAPSEEMVREHARQGGFPASRISEVRFLIDPTSAENSEFYAALAGSSPQGKPELCIRCCRRNPSRKGVLRILVG